MEAKASPSVVFAVAVSWPGSSFSLTFLSKASAIKETRWIASIRSAVLVVILWAMMRGMIAGQSGNLPSIWAVDRIASGPKK